MPGSTVLGIIVNYDKNVSDSKKQLAYSLSECRGQFQHIHSTHRLLCLLSASDFCDSRHIEAITKISQLFFFTALAYIPLSSIHYSQDVYVCNVAIKAASDGSLQSPTNRLIEGFIYCKSVITEALQSF